MRHTAAVMPGVQIVPADDPASCRAVEDVQRVVWGGGDRAVVPAEQIRAVAHNGGMLLLARADEELVGFCYAFVGICDDRPIWCSHMLAVLPAWRSHRIGQALKLAQRDLARQRGITKITWTFDPLQARNAYINLRRLGAWARRYLVDHYGAMDDAINRGMPTDRLLAEWPVSDEDAGRPVTEQDPQDAASERDPRRGDTDRTAWLLGVDEAGAGGDPETSPRPGVLAPDASPTGGLIAVPSDIEQLRASDPDLLDTWRLAVRAAFQCAFAMGLTAVDLRRDIRPGVCAYVLRPS